MTIVPIAITFIHNIATAFWVGGMLVLLFSVLPSIKPSSENEEGKLQFLKAFTDRNSTFIYGCILVLILTGILLNRLTGQSTRFLQFKNAYTTILSMKHILYLLMAAITLGRSIQVRKMDMRSKKKTKIDGIAFIKINAALGVVVILLSSALPFLAY